METPAVLKYSGMYNKYTWQYNGAAPWSDIYRWCLATFGTRFWTNAYETIAFDTEEDLTLFLLRWA